jgi:hypothetical protein
MRTTVTLEDDVAAALARLEKQEGIPPKEAINMAVRAFVAGRTRKSTGPAYRTPEVDLGRCKIGTLDDVGEALALGEGDDAR